VTVLRGTAVLAVVLIVTAVGCGLWGASREFVSPWKAAGVAAFVCWVAGFLGLAAVQWSASRWPAQGALLGTLVRMSVPFPVGILLQKLGGELAESRVFTMIVAGYLVMLITETLLVLKELPSTGSRPRSAEVKST